MAIFSASTLIRVHTLFVLLPAAVCFIFAPEMISDSALTWILGESLQLPDRSNKGEASPVTALILLLAAATQLSFRPPAIQGTSRYNVVTFSAAHTLTNIWIGLASTLTVSFLAGAVAIFAIARNEVEGPWAAVADRTAFAACFVELISWFWINTALREEFGELNEVGRHRAEEWGLNKGGKYRDD